MSARVSNCVPMRNCGPSSRQKKIALEVDLNVPLYDHCSFIEIGTSAGAPVAPELRGGQQRTQPPPVTIDVDSIDDDVVVLSSSRDFAEARNNSRRGRSRSDVIDVELVESSSRDAANSSNKRRRIPTNQPIIDCEALVIPDRNNSIVIEYGRNMAVRQRKFMAPPPPPPPPPPPAPEPTFSCPVCMGPFVEETSTKCGHIFCKACVKKAISVWRECPVCRTKLTMRNTIRVFLPKLS